MKIKEVLKRMLGLEGEYREVDEDPVAAKSSIFLIGSLFHSICK